MNERGNWFSREQRKNLLRLSLFMGAVFVFVAFGFALIAQSGANLFDGVYSLIAFFMALLTRKVANLVPHKKINQ
jgi:predicted Co/Zn/Cd cation transporter (cation efflux family)